MAVVAAFCGDHPRESGAALPSVTSISQVTHDGVTKTNLLADESHLYVTERWAQSLITKVSPQGSDRQIIFTRFPSLQALDLSPDRAKLLVAPIQGGSADKEFWTLPVTGGTSERVGTLTGRDGSWSADGQRLAFGKGPDLYVASSTGNQVHKLFTASGPVFAPRFSPDGRRIRFTVSNVEHGTTELWEAGRDGSNPHALLPHWKNRTTACCGRWTADGRYYIFQTTLSESAAITILWALPDSRRAANPSEPVPTQLTTGPTSYGYAVPASDNKTIWAIGVQPAVEAVKYDPDKKEFVPLIAGTSATDLNFSSDGKWVAYVTIPEGTLWRCRADGTERLQLSSEPERTALPHWSPDGKSIEYARIEPGKPWRISVIPADGGVSQDVLVEDRSQVDASWSPDGTRIMIGYFLDVNGINIQIVDLATHKTETVPGSEGLFSPRWSPDGRYVAALSTDLTKVMLFDFNSQKWSNWLTTAAGVMNYPTWSADSEYLYYDDLVTGEDTIRRVKVGENQAERVFTVEGIDRYLGRLGIWSGRTADGSMLFVRDRSAQEVYRLTVELP
jgi:Tol biopolymer transport system component